MGNKRITCAACGFVGNVSGRGNWPSVHSCPKAGEHTPGDHCPIHGESLVWHVGPFSTFKQCEAPRCAAGKDRKGYAVPFRVYPDKGSNASESKPTPTTPTEAPSESLPMTTTISPAPQSTPLNAYGPLGDAIAQYVETRAQMIASEMLAEALKNHTAAPLSVEWSVNSKPFAKVTGTRHKAVDQILRGIARGFRNFYLVGPAGTGKTTILRTLAGALNNGDGVRHGEISCTQGIPESRLIGRSIPNVNGGPSTYESTPFVEIFEGGGVFLIDENDRADANMLLCLQSALANGHMAIPRAENPVAERHPDTVILCAANTYGTGPDRQYIGAAQLDAAYLDRFVGAMIDVDYDRDLESSIVGNANICARVWKIRDAVSTARVRRVVGTRFLIAVAKHVAGGDSLDTAIEACTTGWTSDERAKAGL